MIWLRSFAYAAGVWLFTPPFVLLTLPACLLLPAHARYALISLWAKTMLRWLAFTCGVRYRVLGAEHIPQQACVILSKHQSAWETMAFQRIFPHQVWVLKRELLWIPFFGWGLAMTSPIAIDRSAGREALKQLVAQGKDRLARGFFVVIFPEGTRMAPGTRGKYHIGGAWLATHTGTPVLPVAHNAGNCWGKNAFLKKPGLITVSIGPMISAEGLKPDAVNQQAEAWIEAEMQRLESM